jgi:hypothetical protein
VIARNPFVPDVGFVTLGINLSFFKDPLRPIFSKKLPNEPEGPSAIAPNSSAPRVDSKECSAAIHLLGGKLQPQLCGRVVAIAKPKTSWSPLSHPTERRRCCEESSSVRGTRPSRTRQGHGGTVDVSMLEFGIKHLLIGPRMRGGKGLREPLGSAKPPFVIPCCVLRPVEPLLLESLGGVGIYK